MGPQDLGSRSWKSSPDPFCPVFMHAHAHPACRSFGSSSTGSLPELNSCSLPQQSPTPLRKQAKEMEAFNKPLSTKTSLPTATKRLCENKSTDATASPVNCFHPSWLVSVQICRGYSALPPPFSADTGLSYARPCSLIRHCC